MVFSCNMLVACGMKWQPLRICSLCVPQGTFARAPPSRYMGHVVDGSQCEMGVASVLTDHLFDFISTLTNVQLDISDRRNTDM